MMSKITQTAGRTQLGDFAPIFAHLNDDVLFGEAWNEEVLMMLDLGYAADGVKPTPGHSTRKPLSETVSWL